MSVMKMSSNIEKKAELKKRRAELIRRAQSSNIQRWLHLMRREVDQEKRLLEEQEIFSDDSQKDLIACKSDDDQKLQQETQSARISVPQEKRPTFHSPSNREIIECRTKMLEEKIREDARHSALIRSCTRDDSFAKKQYFENNERKNRYRVDLQNQILYNSQRGDKMKKDEQADNRELENIRQSVLNEEIRMKNERKILANSFHSEKILFPDEKEVFCDKEKELVPDKGILGEKHERELEREKHKYEVEKAREKLLEKFARKLFDDECQALEREIDNYELRTSENKLLF